MPHHLLKPLLSLGALTGSVAIPALAMAQNSVAAKETSVHGGVLVIITYLILWGMIFGFVALVMMRQKKAAQELSALEKRLDSLFPEQED